MALERPVEIRLQYHVEVESVPEEIWMLCETPEIYRIQINGKALDCKQEGWYIDKSFQKLNIAGFLQTGTNTITMEVSFRQDEEVYECVRKSKIFESEKNKLHYGMEIEPVYLIGNFGVRATGKVTPLDKQAFRVPNGFVICQLPRQVSLQELEKQGFLFFAGALTVSKKMTLDSVNYELALTRKGINAVEAVINGRTAGSILYESQRLACSDLLQVGENQVTLTIRNNLRNMMGPHHLESGESYVVCPDTFFQEPCVFSLAGNPDWNGDYCFVEMSLETQK